ncbi:hypothetical protein LINPERPRIM_LOCUS25257 [Linum perenne]
MLLVLRELQQGELPSKEGMVYADFWIQVSNLCAGFHSKSVARALGNFVGTFLSIDERAATLTGGQIMRLRARLDIRDPLKKEKKIRKPNGDWLMAKFRYERLPNFCFICGHIGHIDRHCEIYFRLPDDKIIRNWDITLCAPPLKSSMLGGEKWLVEEGLERGDDGTALQGVDLNTHAKPLPNSFGLLANLGASRITQSLSLKEVYEMPNIDDEPLTLPDDRKRQRHSDGARSGAENMDYEPSMHKGADKVTRGIQVPSNLATAGLRGGSSCPGQ